MIKGVKMIVDLKLWLIVFVMINRTTAIVITGILAQISLPPNASWDPHGVTVAGWANGSNGSSLTQLSLPFGISVTDDDVLYVSDSVNNRVAVVPLNSLLNISIIGSGPGNGTDEFNIPFDLCIRNASLYVIEVLNHRVQKMSLDGSNPSTAPGLSELNWPYYLYVDNHENLYLSDTGNHRVLLFPSNGTNFSIVAGTGVAGASNSQLQTPYGVFADKNATIYIADCWNHRIMKWFLGASVGIMAAGDGAPGASSTQLYAPTQIIIDTNGFMYISEAGNARITRWAPNSSSGVCIAACTGMSGIASTELYSPHSLTFDRYGSLYVTDRSNHRIQKFQILQYQSPSYNQPKFAACATWNPNAITFANSTTIGTIASGMYVDINNTIYVADPIGNRVQVWLEGNMTPARTIASGLNSSFSVFASIFGNIYIDNGVANHRVDMWAENATNGVVAMNVIDRCINLFIDIYNTLYCSNDLKHQVVKVSLSDGPNAMVIVAGTGVPGILPNMFTNPNGIFVDTELNLYVADWGNDRIQFFQRGQQNATTLAGNGAPGTILLSRPSAVVLDADQYLFISDSENHRIIRSGPGGFHCLLGCISRRGSAPYQMYRPYTLNFDSYGNLFVADLGNSRIQKFLLATNSCVPSYNQPKFSSCATWNPNATTIANVTLIGDLPIDVFVDVNDTVYTADRTDNWIQVWSEGKTDPIRTISGGFNSAPFGIFVTLNGDIYSDNGAFNRTVDKWTFNATTSVVAMYVTGSRFSLFIDINDYLYCSTESPHQVVKHSLNSDANTSTIVAGNGTAGSASDMLDSPRGIFVDMNLKLYVADCNNNRIQLFQPGQSNGMTLVINGSNGTFTLNCPTDVILDIDGYLFIADAHNNRILGSGPMGFRCIAGCTGFGGLAPDQLYLPHSLGFDSKGNLFVIEYSNYRLQKFFLSSDSCDETTTYLTETTAPDRQEQTSIVTTVPSSTRMTNQSCFPPAIILIPSTSSFSSPLQFRRSQDFYISSYIQLNCNSSLSKITQWTIYNCTSTSCSSQIQIDPTVQATFSELYIPARILPYGIYQLKLKITMTTSSTLISSSSAYVRINPSGITANLVQYGTSMITRGHEQDLILDPGTFSVNPDGNIFNETDWKYKYYCRIYGRSSFPNVNGSLLSIDDPTVDPLNPSCLSNQTAWKYGDLIQSSITIVSRSLLANQTYQFMVYMENRRNSSVQVTGYLLVKVDDTHPQLIIVACVISIMCVPNVEFQLVNPTTQVALFSLCQGNCSVVQNITWNLYYGSYNASSNFTQWTLFNKTTSYENIWFFGRTTANFTATNQLFLSYSQYNLWRFEVIYTFTSEQSSSALNFVINQPPQNGSCFIDPLNGTTTTLFNISCPNWFDEDGIKYYSLYSYTTADRSNALIIAFSSAAEFTVRLPCGNENTSLVDLVVSIRDTLDCITEVNITSVIVKADLSSISLLMDTFHTSPDALSTNAIVQFLSSGNQNTVGQILTSIAQQFNTINTQSLGNAVSNGVPASSISISSLSADTSSAVQSVPLNDSALLDYDKDLNSYANVRDYLMNFTTTLLISTSQSIILQASTLVQLTGATNQLTRSTAVVASERCYQLAQSLYSMSRRISYEDLQSAVNQITQCTSNALTAINGPLQGRTRILQLDLSRTNQFPEDYDTDLESPWSNLNLFADGNDFSWETIEKNRNIYYQKQAADQIKDQTSQTLALLTAALNIHLNIGQNQTINTSSVFMSYATISSESLSKKTIEGVGNVRIDLPSTTGDDQTMSLRLIVQPLASADQSQVQPHTNLSRSISFSILDRDGNEKSLSTTVDHPYRLIIPRDPTMIIPPMTLQNVTSLNSTPHHLLFNLHYISIVQMNNLTNSIHIEIKPLNINVAYLFIARFDQIPQMNNSMMELFCPSNLPDDQIYKSFFDNQQTKNHQSLIFGLRELNATEFDHYCSNHSTNQTLPIFDQPFHFTFNYALRVYSSACYFLDENNQWKSDGLIVGSLTNHNETECFSILL